MDNVVSEAQNTMINQLNFGLPETSQYITDRRFVNYFPSTSSTYSSQQGNQNMRFYISGDSNTYLDLSSIRLFATLQNNDESDRAKFLRPLGGLHSFFQRYRASVGGQMVQDITEYNRHCETYKSFKSKDVNEMDDIESSANPSWDDDYHRYANGLNNFLDYYSVISTSGNATQGKTNGAGTDADPRGVVDVNLSADHNELGRIGFRPTRHSLSGIPGNKGKMRLGHKPVCGLLESNYYLPLRFAPLELEFTIVSDGNEPIVVPAGDAQANPTTETDKQGYYFQAGNTSTKWELNNIIIRAEVITLDNTVDNNITKHLLEGQSLKLIVPQYHTLTQNFNVGGGEINANLVKSASKLSTAFITLYRPKQIGTRYGYFRPSNYLHKRYNYLYNPMINSEINDGFDTATNTAIEGKGFQDYSRNLSWQLQVANKKYPEFECQSLSEAFYYLRRTLHYMNGDQNSLNITYKQYREDKFIIGMSFEKMQDTSFTGTNTKMGSLITFKIKATEGVLAEAEQIQEIFIHMISESVLELTESGAIVYD